MQKSNLSSAGSFALATLATGSLLALASLEANPLARAESELLLLMSLFIFSGLALIRGRGAADLGFALFLPLLPIWLLTAPTLRAPSFVGLSLLAGLTLLTLRFNSTGTRGKLPLGPSLGVWIGAQGLFASRSLLSPNLPNDLWPLLGLPTVCALLCTRLSVRWQRSDVLLLAGTLMILGRGASPNTLATLLVLVLWEEFRGARTTSDPRQVRTLPPWLVAAALVTTVGLVWWLQNGFGYLLALVVVASALDGRRLLSWCLAIATTVGAAWVLGWSFGPHPGVISRLTFLLPATVLSLAFANPVALTALALGALTGAFGNAPELLMPAAALGIRAIVARPSLKGAQHTWTALMFACAAFLASYPWLRTGLIRRVLELFDWTLFDGHILWLLALTATAFAAAALAPWPHKALAGRIAMAVLLAAIALMRLEPSHSKLHYGPMVLHEGKVRTRVAFRKPIQPRRMVIESSVSNGYALEAGSLVALVRVGKDGNKLGTEVLRIGVHTGEWAAERPDVAANFPSESTGVWVHWPSDGSKFFARRYRSEWQFDGNTMFDELKITLRQGLPDGFQLTIHRLEVVE